MIYLDDRAGSGDLVTFLQRWNIPHELGRLPYGDAAFTGNGPCGTIDVGVEIKKVRDALNCMCDGRFAAKQLPGLVKSYQMNWLVIEGSYGVDFVSGQMTVSGHKGRRSPLTLGRRTFLYREFDAWLTTMEVKGGMKVRRTLSRVETARFLVDLWSWWTKKEYSKHRSHLAPHTVQPDEGLLVAPSLVVRMAAQLPGVGWTRAQAVGARFTDPIDMLIATVEDWMEIPGIGEGIARKIVEVIHG